MSQIASALYIPAYTLPTVVDAVSAGSPLPAASISGGRHEVFASAGCLIAALLPILDQEYGIPLMRSEAEAAGKLSSASKTTFVVLTEAEASSLVAATEPKNFDAARLGEQFDAFTAETNSGAGEAMLAGVAFLHGILQKLCPGEVVLLHIG